MAFAGAFVIEEPVFKAYAQEHHARHRNGYRLLDRRPNRQMRFATAKSATARSSGPPMSFGWYKAMSDTDVRAIVAYLQN